MKSHPAFKAVIFDIDNVLIDTRRSYHDAIRWTVEIYLTSGSIPFFTPPRPSRRPQLLSIKDVDRFKWLGGFNDDWDCCYGLLTYILNLPVKSRSFLDLKRTIDLNGFAKRVKRRPLGVSGIVNLLGRSSAVLIEKISRIFQEVYLGKDLFQKVQFKRPLYWNKRGLIHKERFIFRKSTLVKLKKWGVKLGIATGRPRFEARHALERFGVLHLFEAITSIDDVRKAEREMRQSLRKPHPYSLLETARQLGVRDRLMYIGDLPDDILAAEKAKESIDISSVAFPWYSSHPFALQEIKGARPDFILKKPSELSPLIYKGKLKS